MLHSCTGVLMRPLDSGAFPAWCLVPYGGERGGSLEPKCPERCVLWKKTPNDLLFVHNVECFEHDHCWEGFLIIRLML